MENTEPTEPTQQEPQTEPENNQQEPENNQQQATEELTDRHGQPAISKGKYDREIQQRDKKIAELEAKIDEASKTAEAKADLEKQIKQLKQDLKDKGIDSELQLAGCVNVKAARAVLDDYQSVDELKEKCPYLFAQQQGSTGRKPNDTTGADERRKRARAAAGLE